MLNRTRFLLTMLACALAASPVRASFPGRADEGAQASDPRWVLASDTASECIPVLFQGQSSFAAPITVRDSGGNDCVPDYIEGAELRGLITLVIDDNSAGVTSGNATTCATGQMRSLSMILELEAGQQRTVIAENFAAACDANLFISGWAPANDPVTELWTFNAVIGNALDQAAFVETKAAVRDFAVQALAPTVTIPSDAVMLFGDPLGNVFRKNVPATPAADCPSSFGNPGPCGPGETNASGDTTASVARYRITIRFAAAPLPPAPPEAP